ncbi:translation initiation factor 2 [Solibacillus sp. A46]|uniref:Translation initiation factor 2 n=1 Tax=Solibacillus faecavium TaxID=2762221 RepID=A0ABR8XZE6_9BACL|nr:translation initiation factor 2 [Solibacillus faecavium]MBD8037308.1 translation initiation factor 2 [Solibacillus faecavium]
MKALKNNAIFQAMFIGSLTGLAGVLVFIFILQLPTTEKEVAETIPTVQTTEEQQQVKQQYFALQHGVFSNFDSAAQFLGTYPTLNKAAVVKVDEQYFVWSRLDTTKVDAALALIPSGFYKSITIASSCPNNAELQLPITLKDTKMFTGQQTDTIDEQLVPTDWIGLASEVSKLSTNPNIIRLHMFLNYYERLDCLKVTF